MERQWRDRILIIDSDEQALGVITNFLVNHGFNVVTASAVEAALNALRSCEYDLILADSHFADLTLSGFVSRLLRIPRKAPVIVMETSPCRPCGLAPFNPARSTRFVNKWRPCEILDAVRQAHSEVAASPTQ